MPRSGTSLTEQIVSSHEKVFGGAPDTDYEEFDPETGLPVDDDPNPFI